MAEGTIQSINVWFQWQWVVAESLYGDRNWLLYFSMLKPPQLYFSGNRYNKRSKPSTYLWPGEESPPFHLAFFRVRR